MQLIIITSDILIERETEIVNRLFEDGLLRLHLRKPSFTTERYRNYLAEIDSQYYSRISIHGSFGLVREFKLGGIHLNGYSRNDEETRQQIKDIPSPVISTSFHGWKEMEDNTFPYGYVFISPVFDSISKAGYMAAIDLTEASETKQGLASQNKYCPQIIGLGGVGAHQIGILHRYGFDGAAMLGAIWQSENPVKAFVDAKEIIDSLQGR